MDDIEQVDEAENNIELQSNPHPTSNSIPDLLTPTKINQTSPIINHISPRRRPPKLSALRNVETFSKTISGFDPEPLEPLTIEPQKPLNRQMSHQDGRRMLMTPKRKCSFSSFSECRYVTADGGKTKTFLFSIEAASPSEAKGRIEDVAHQTESFVGLSGASPTSKRSKFHETNEIGGPSSIEWSSSRDTDHSSVFGITSARIGSGPKGSNAGHQNCNFVPF